MWLASIFDGARGHLSKPLKSMRNASFYSDGSHTAVQALDTRRRSSTARFGRVALGKRGIATLDWAGATGKESEGINSSILMAGW